MHRVKLLELANKAYSLYLQQPSYEKARLLRIVQSNCSWDGINPRPTYKKPFDLLAKGLSSGNWLSVVDEIRNFCLPNPAKNFSYNL